MAKMGKEIENQAKAAQIETMETENLSPNVDMTVATHRAYRRSPLWIGQNQTKLSHKKHIKRYF